MENKIPRKISELIEGDDIFFQAEIKIGPFKLLNQIGEGRFATVFLGIHEETKEKVAIKRIKKSELNTDNLLTKEINIHKILFHPYLIKMYCVIENEENIFIITEYCSNEDLLKNIIKVGSFDEPKSCKIFQQILSSLEYLHKNNICHRDIKPENILLDEYGDAKLSDFGLSRKFDNNELLKTPCGSPIYAAPEMLLGKKYKGTNIDIWSLGISLYTMLCGELPFEIDDENDMKTLVYNIIHGKYTIPDNLSPSCRDLIQKILEINPDKRITIDEIKKHEWVNMFNFNYMKSPGVILNDFFLPIDIYLIKEIIGENENEMRKIINDILMNKHNINTINYYLKNEVRKRKGEKSVSDLRPTSNLFLEYINDDKSKKNYWGNDLKKIIDFYIGQIKDLFKKEKIKQLEIQKEIRDSLKKDNNNPENNIDKKNQMLKYKTELKLSANNEEKTELNKKNEKDNDKSILENKKEAKIEKLKNNKMNNLEIVNLYIGPLIFIHDLIDNIITKVISIETEKNKVNNFFVSSSIKMEITNSKSSDVEKIINNLQENTIDKTTDNSYKLNANISERNIYMYEHYMNKYSINKTNDIEFVHTPKKIKNSFSYINKVQSETIEINSTTKKEKIKRSESCKMRNQKKENNKINKKASFTTKKGNNITNKKRNKTITKITKRNKEEKTIIIKSIDLRKKGYISINKKKNILKKKNKSISNIKHLQLNIINNDIVIKDIIYSSKDNINNGKEIGLLNNYSQNYIFDLNKSIKKDSKLMKNKLSNYKNSKFKSQKKNKISSSTINNSSIDINNYCSSKKESKINLIKVKNFLNNKKEIKFSYGKNNVFNNFLKTPNKLKNKKGDNTSMANISSYFSLGKNPKDKKIKKVIFINNNNKVYTEINSNTNNYSNYKNRNHSQLISLLNYSNENGSINKAKKLNLDKKDNNPLIKCRKSPNNDLEKLNDIIKNSKTNNNINSIFSRKLFHNNDTKIVKTELNGKNSQSKRKVKKNVGKENEKLIKTKLPIEKIKQIIKQYVGNNVKSDFSNGFQRFICKTKNEKEELNFILEVSIKNYDTSIIKGTLEKGETKAYKELLNKIKEKLN